MGSVGATIARSWLGAATLGISEGVNAASGGSLFKGPAGAGGSTAAPTRADAERQRRSGVARAASSTGRRSTLLSGLIGGGPQPTVSRTSLLGHTR